LTFVGEGALSLLAVMRSDLLNFSTIGEFSKLSLLRFAMFRFVGIACLVLLGKELLLSLYEFMIF